jgi:hypothetical protein
MDAGITVPAREQKWLCRTPLPSVIGKFVQLSEDHNSHIQIFYHYNTSIIMAALPESNQPLYHIQEIS